MWGISWVNFTMDLATIPSTDIKDKTEENDEVISPEDEEAQLRRDFNL